MPKVGKLTILKSALKRMNSFGKQTTTTSTTTTTTTNNRRTTTTAAGYDDRHRRQQPVPRLHTVYVGKSRREYLVTSEVADHPAFQALLSKSDVVGDGGSGPSAGEITVACEVVLFEHLLWMLENIDPDEMDSLDELVAFYS